MSHVDEGALHAYLDGALPPDERSQVETHLAGCTECQERLAEAQALIARADALLGLALPEKRAAPPLHELRRPLWWRVRWPVAWAASIMLAVSVGWMLRGRPIEQETVARAAPDTSPPIFGLSEHYIDESRQPAAAPAPANRSRTGAGAPREEAQNRAHASRADSGTPAANAAVEAVPGITPSIVARDRAAAPALKPAAPAPAAPVTVDGMIATGAAAPQLGRALPVMSSTWPIIQRGSATRMLGTELAMIPGVPLKDIRMSPYSDGVVLVEQEIDSTVVIQLFQRRADAATDSLAERGYQLRRQRAAERERVERLARFVGPLRVEIAGPLGTDSLSKLLELVATPQAPPRH